MSILERKEYIAYQVGEPRGVWEDDYEDVISIDPGLKHYAFRIERRYRHGDAFTIAMELASFPDKKHPYPAITSFLNKYSRHYPCCHRVIIEQQPPLRIDMNRVFQHTLTYFLLHLQSSPLSPVIYEVSPKLKGKVLGAPPKTNKRELKKLSQQKGEELLRQRGDKKGLQILASYRKKDDLTDTIWQIEGVYDLLRQK